MSYEKLPEDEKKQNRSNVQDIPHKLALANYVMIPSRSHNAPVAFPPSVVEQLAEMEHERWLETKLEAGWRWAPKIGHEFHLLKSLTKNNPHATFYTVVCSSYHHTN